LHQEDKKILQAGEIGYQHLVTIRPGETAFNPLTAQLEPVSHELVKVGGRGQDWACLFFRAVPGASCGIYRQRPLECRLLKCWDTAELAAVVGKNTISRADIIKPADPLLRFIAIHEQQCSCRRLNELLAALPEAAAGAAAASGILAGLTGLARRDLALRAQARAELGLSIAVELFVFGRPLFIILQSHGLAVREAAGAIQVNLPTQPATVKP